MKNALVVVMCHSPVKETCLRHLQLWEHHGCKIATVCPSDAPVNLSGITFCHGNSQHHGDIAIERFREMLKWMDDRPEDHFLINEYDSFCLDPSPHILDGAFQCGEAAYGNYHDDDSPSFHGKCFIHPPIFMGHAAISRLLGAICPCLSSERGYWDRWLGNLCSVANVKILPYGDLGFSVNTIDQSRYPAVEHAIKNGAVMIHGVKSEEALTHVLRCRRDKTIQG